MVDITSLTLTVTPAAASRRIRITCDIPAVSSTVATDLIIVTIMEGATQLGQKNVLQGSGLTAFAIITPTLAAHTYKAQIQRVGTGNGTLSASGTAPASLLVEDIGT